MNTHLTLPAASLISKDLLAQAVETYNWVPYYNFLATPVPEKILAKDPFLVKLSRKRMFHAGILKMEPNTCYNWHVDTDRKVGLNMLLMDQDSQCLFLDGEPGVVVKTKELEYKPDTYYAFNTQIPHMVINTIGPRYLFSLQFVELGLTFDELCKDIKGMDHGY